MIRLIGQETSLFSDLSRDIQVDKNLLHYDTYFSIYDLSIGSTETKYIKLNTKTQLKK